MFRHPVRRDDGHVVGVNKAQEKTKNAPIRTRFQKEKVELRGLEPLTPTQGF